MTSQAQGAPNQLAVERGQQLRLCCVKWRLYENQEKQGLRRPEWIWNHVSYLSTIGNRQILVSLKRCVRFQEGREGEKLLLFVCLFVCFAISLFRYEMFYESVMKQLFDTQHLTCLLSQLFTHTHTHTHTHTPAHTGTQTHSVYHLCLLLSPPHLSLCLELGVYF